MIKRLLSGFHRIWTPTGRLTLKIYEDQRIPEIWGNGQWVHVGHPRPDEELTTSVRVPAGEYYILRVPLRGDPDIFISGAIVTSTQKTSREGRLLRTVYVDAPLAYRLLSSLPSEVQHRIFELHAQHAASIRQQAG